MDPAPADPSAPGFGVLAMAPAVLANLERLGYLEMTPVQAATLPLSLAGSDVIAQARTGSGKTAAFALPLLAGIDARRFEVQALVLCPTRELSDQVTQEVRRLARSEDNLKVLTLCGGVPLRDQLTSLTHGAHVIVGTPGRVLDHLARASLRLPALRTLVLDEADRMLDMGFAPAISQVLAQCPRERQTLLFSATLSDEVAALATRFMRDPQRVALPAQHAAQTIRQRFYEVREDQRLHAVSLLLEHYRPPSTLAFCNTRQQCADLAQVLRGQGYQALALHGELEQRERDQVLIRFANRSCSVLVATDVASRGLDVDRLEAVINVDLAPDPQTHLHRIGRTGRAGESGWALSLASLEEMGSVGRIEQLQGREVEWHALDSLTPTHDAPLLAPMVTLQIAGGRKEKIRAGDVLGALTKDLGYAAAQIGRIDVNPFSTYVAVDRQIARAALTRLDGGRIKGKVVKVRALDD
ncbi:MAG: ATP-dependent RNA helicase DbpA [Burkholderiaceae bacterium]